MKKEKIDNTEKSKKNCYNKYVFIVGILSPMLFYILWKITLKEKFFILYEKIKLAFNN